MQRIIVTGATSMMGTALITECLKEGKEVWAVIRKETTKKARLPLHPKLHFVWCSLEELSDLPNRILTAEDVAAGRTAFDTFYHLAWGNTGARRDQSTRLQSNNIGYTLDAVQSAGLLGCKRFIGAGSQAEYGPRSKGPIHPQTETHPVTPYGVSKLAACELSRLLCRELSIEWIWPRIFSVYGKNEKDTTLISTALRSFCAREPISFTPAENDWDFLYSRDAGRAYYLIGEKGRPGAVYCVGSGISRSLAEYIREMAVLCGWPEGARGIGSKPYPPGAVTNLWADIETLREDTGFSPEYTFSRGIGELLQEMRKGHGPQK